MSFSKTFIFCVFFLMGSCHSQNNNTPLRTSEDFNCVNGSMEAAYYEYGMNEPIPGINNPDSGFLILVDSNSKATNFISSEEQFINFQANALDTTFLKRLHPDGWQHLAVSEKLEKLSQEKILYKNQTDSIHFKNNQEQIQIWIINNTSDTVFLQMQDLSYICILQGLTKSGQWFPIQYWQFSKCGNSYYDKPFAPKMANSFITTIPHNGTYETKLRFKLLGKDRFYYSNVFTGKINECDFVDSKADKGTYPEDHYKLDTLTHLEMY